MNRRITWPVAITATLAAIWILGHGLTVPLLTRLGVLGTALDAVITAFLILVAVAVAADLLRKHHRTLAGLAGHHGLRAARGSLRVARAGGARVAAGPGAGKWLAVRDAWTPRVYRGQADEADEAPEDSAGTSTEAAPADEPRVCVACGNPEYGPRRGGGNWGRLVAYLIGGAPRRIHHAHFDDPRSGFHGQPYEELTERNTDMPVSRITPGHRAQRTATRSGGTISGGWAQVVAGAADLEAESDEHLIEWMNNEATGMAAYAEAVVDSYETHVNVTGLDPRALAALHDYADAAAQAAELMAAAKNKFTGHYELPREFAANGGLMPHDGRWVTGEGA